MESGVKYIRRNFICGLLGREPHSLEDTSAELRWWVWEVANQRVHGTTHCVVQQRWREEKPPITLAGRLPYPFFEEELRRGLT